MTCDLLFALGADPTSTDSSEFSSVDRPLTLETVLLYLPVYTGGILFRNTRKSPVFEVEVRAQRACTEEGVADIRQHFVCRHDVPKLQNGTGKLRAKIGAFPPPFIKGTKMRLHRFFALTS